MSKHCKAFADHKRYQNIFWYHENLEGLFFFFFLISLAEIRRLWPLRYLHKIQGTNQQLVSLAYHQDWKRGDTAGLDLSNSNIHLPASLKLTVLLFISFCIILKKNWCVKTMIFLMGVKTPRWTVAQERLKCLGSHRLGQRVGLITPCKMEICCFHTSVLYILHK